MKKNKKFDFLDWNNKVLTSSFKKVDLNIIFIVIADVLFYFLSGYAAISWLQRIQFKMTDFNIPNEGPPCFDSHYTVRVDYVLKGL